MAKHIKKGDPNVGEYSRGKLRRMSSDHYGSREVLFDIEEDIAKIVGPGIRERRQAVDTEEKAEG